MRFPKRLSPDKTPTLSSHGFTTSVRRAGSSSSPKGSLAALTCLALFLTGCDGSEPEPTEDKNGLPSVDPSVLLDKDSPQLPDQPPDEPLGRALEEVTGTWSKVVWMQHDNPDTADTYATGGRHHLWGIDSRDGLGVRQLLEDRGNYSRPMISPDGRMIVYTDKQVDRDKKGRKKYDVTVMVTDWNGAEPRALADGYASDLWRDPDNGEVWVIASRDLLTSDRASMFAKKLVRFRLDDPSVEETLWDQTQTSPDNIQLSRDGQRASGQFPWPEVGVFDFANDDWQRLAHGCWPSHSPDDSYISWVFDGAHRTLTMFQRGEGKSWPVPVNQAPGVDGAEVYHPRWSNHPRFLAITGPYADEKNGRNPITVGGTHAEVYIGRFKEDLTEVEAWVSLTDNDVGDFYPDLWVHNGHKEILTGFPQGPQAGGVPETTDSWPANGQPLLFAWQHRNHRNQFTDSTGDTRPFQLDARSLARYGRHHQALLDAGHFEPDSRSAEAVNKALADGASVTVESLITAEPHFQSAPGIIWQLGGLSLEARDDGLLLRQGENTSALETPAEGGPMHVAAALTNGQPVRVWINGSGAAMDSAMNFTVSADSGLRVGGGNWPGGLERLAVYQATLEPTAIAELANAALATTTGRESLPVLRLRGRLVQTTPVPSEEEIDPYTSALVEYIYEVEEVLEGDYEHDQVLVRHWGLLDRENAPGFPRETGSSHELMLQPWDQHPQLAGERRTEDTGNFVLPVFYDIAPARP